MKIYPFEGCRLVHEAFDGYSLTVLHLRGFLLDRDSFLFPFYNSVLKFFAPVDLHQLAHFERLILFGPGEDRETTREVYADWLWEHECFDYSDLVREKGLDFEELVRLQEEMGERT
jgi:uncharacterized protein (TIGR02996 family)